VNKLTPGEPDNLVYTVFVSYSRIDASIVKPIVEVIRATGPSVFRDEDSIRPGSRWRAEISSAIERCKAILIFWCEHACVSVEVQAEYERAMKLGKDVVPILLDSTPLSKALAEYQAIDLRNAFNGHGDEIEVKETKGKVEAEGEGKYYDDGWGGRTRDSAEHKVREEAEKRLDDTVEKRRQIAEREAREQAATILNEIVEERRRVQLDKLKYTGEYLREKLRAHLTEENA
jgi:hypothetical protein